MKSKTERRIDLRGNKRAFQIVEALLSSLLFIFLYQTSIHNQVEGAQGFLLTWVAMVITGFIGNGIARMVVQYWKTHFQFKNLNRTLINTLIYTILIASGYIQYVFDTYPLVSVTEMSVIVILFIVKIVTFVFSDFFSAKIK